MMQLMYSMRGRFVEDISKNNTNNYANLTSLFHKIKNNDVWGIYRLKVLTQWGISS